MDKILEFGLIFFVLWIFYKIFIGVIMGIDDDEE